MAPQPVSLRCSCSLAPRQQLLFDGRENPTNVVGCVKSKDARHRRGLFDCVNAMEDRNDVQKQVVREMSSLEVFVSDTAVDRDVILKTVLEPPRVVDCANYTVEDDLV